MKWNCLYSDYVRETKVGTTRDFGNIDFSEDEGIWFMFRILVDNKHVDAYLKVCFDI